MVFLRPVEHGVEDIARRHGAFRGDLAAAARAVARAAVRPAAVMRPRGRRKEAGIERVGVVVDDVQDDAQAVLMQREDGLLELADAHLAVRGVACIRALRHVVVDRIIAPVVALRCAALVDGAEVEHGHQLDMRDAEPPEVGKARGMHAVAAKRRLRLTQGAVFAPVRFADARGGIKGEILDVDLVDDVLALSCGGAVLRPAGRIGPPQVDDHAALAVEPAGARIGVGRPARHAVHAHLIIIIYPVELPGNRAAPDSPLAGGQDMTGEGAAPAALRIQAQRHGLRRRRPEGKAGLPALEKRAQRLRRMICPLEVLAVKAGDFFLFHAAYSNPRLW